MKIKKGQYTKVQKYGTRFVPLFCIDNQAFHIGPVGFKRDAEWYCEQFEYALNNLLKKTRR